MEVLKDKDCTINTPVVLGVQDSPIYGKGISIKPRVDGRKDSKHFESIYLPELLPLEEYDLIVVLISGGKDSIACFYKLLELGVPKEKIELWHHDIDGGHPSRRMDWKCTQNYMKALADAEGVKLRVSYRVNGFFGELYRIGASEPIEWIDPDTDEVKQCKLSSNYLKCQEIKEQCLEEMEDLLKEYGCRMKFPAKSPDLSKRWCSAYLKVMVADSVVSNLDRLEELGGKRHKFPAKGGTHQGRWCSGNLKAAVQDSVTANLEETKQDKKILIVSGERRGESAGRSKYNEIEIHRTNAEKRNHRIVHQWRCCIDYTEKDVWEVLKRHHVNPHPCYRLGWNRCSCAACIFSTPGLMKGFSEIYPDKYKELRDDEERLGFTLDNKKNLDDFICGAKSCLCLDDARQLCGQYSEYKLQAFRELVESTQDRLIVFYNFTAEYLAMVQIAEELGRPQSIVNGQQKQLLNYEQCDNSITFIQYQAGAMGLNLQKANKIIYFTLTDKSELYEQSKKRIHRIGQEQPCFYYMLMCKGSVEEAVLQTLEMRKDFTDELFNEYERMEK